MNVASAQPAQRGFRAIGLPVWILLGAFAGVIAGVLFGERTSILQPIGEAYARMLEIAVYPYILSSLLHGLGRLTPKMAWRLLGSGWYVYVFVWIATLGSIWLLAQAIPPPPLPSVLSSEALQPKADVLTLLIPDNFIGALGRNYMPAVAVFAIFYGVAIQEGRPEGRPVPGAASDTDSERDDLDLDRACGAARGVRADGRYRRQHSASQFGRRVVLCRIIPGRHAPSDVCRVSDIARRARAGRLSRPQGDAAGAGSVDDDHLAWAALRHEGGPAHYGSGRLSAGRRA